VLLLVDKDTTAHDNIIDTDDALSTTGVEQNGKFNLETQQNSKSSMQFTVIVGYFSFSLRCNPRKL